MTIEEMIKKWKFELLYQYKGRNVRLEEQARDRKVDTYTYLFRLSLGDEFFVTTLRYHNGQNRPNLYDVLTSLQVDCGCGEMTYADYLSEFGYGDTGKNRKDHAACARMVELCKKLLGDEMYELFLRAEDTGLERDENRGDGRDQAW